MIGQHERRVGGYCGRDCKVLEGLGIRSDVELRSGVWLLEDGVLELMRDGKDGGKLLLRRD